MGGGRKGSFWLECLIAAVPKKDSFRQFQFI
jgi:hypothetical protein